MPARPPVRRSHSFKWVKQENFTPICTLRRAFSTSMVLQRKANSGASSSSSAFRALGRRRRLRSFRSARRRDWRWPSSRAMRKRSSPRRASARRSPSASFWNSRTSLPRSSRRAVCLSSPALWPARRTRRPKPPLRWRCLATRSRTSPWR